MYERGLGACSSDYLAHSLWDKYIHYEEEQGSAAAVAALYSRALQCPLRELPRYMQRCAALLLSNSSARLRLGASSPFRSSPRSCVLSSSLYSYQQPWCNISFFLSSSL